MPSIEMTLHCALDKGQMFPAQSGLDSHGPIGEYLKMRFGENVNAEVAKDMKKLLLGSGSVLVLHQFYLGVTDR
jgi:hypothetical protein